MSIIDMRPYMGNDLAGVFTYDFPDTVVYQGNPYKAIIKDRVLEELDEYGGPILINILEIHILTAALPSVINGLEMIAKQETKIIKSSTLSEDGNELIVNVRSA